MTNVAAGWYQDPYEPATYRWWDGAQWTSQTSPGGDPATQSDAAPGSSWGHGPVDVVVAAVDHFCDALTPLVVAAEEGAMDEEAVRRVVGAEACSLSMAYIDLDTRETDMELQALVAAFAERLPDTGLQGNKPDDIRAAATIQGKSQFLWTPSPMFDLLAGVDARSGTHSAWTYLDAALGLAHAFTALDAHPSPIALAAIESYRSKLRSQLGEPSGSDARPPLPPWNSQADQASGSPVAVASGPHSANDPAASGPTKPTEPEGPAEPLATLMAELDALIGLDRVKREVHGLIDLLRVEQIRRQHDLPVVDTALHQVFVGNPGTGKTTVARLIGRIFRTLGVVTRGQLVETDRAGLVAGYEGQTAIQVTKRFDEANGGVLFIDEAYSLSRGIDDGFGQEAIDTIVKLMEDRRATTVVIVAGYTDEMADFISANPGLSSRFARTIEFDDYDADSLVRIFDTFATQFGYQLDADAATALKAHFTAEHRAKGFGNGRNAANLFEAVVTAQAARVVDIATPTVDQLKAVCPADLAAAVAALGSPDDPPNSHQS